MSRVIVFVFVLLLNLVVLDSTAQFRKQNNFSTDKFYFGGGGGLSGGNQFISVSVSPLVGYKITPQFSTGLQITYQYTKLSIYSASNYGGGPFVAYAFSKNIFSYAQYEYLSVQTEWVDKNSTQKAPREGNNALFGGIGYNSPISDNVSFQILGLYNFMYGDGSKGRAYDSPLQIRVGLVTGF